jgi:hypothetical protein
MSQFSPAAEQLARELKVLGDLKETTLQVAETVQVQLTEDPILRSNLALAAAISVSSPPGLEFNAKYIAEQSGMDELSAAELVRHPLFNDVRRTLELALKSKLVSSVEKTLFIKAIQGSPLHMKLFFDRADREEAAGADISISKLLQVLKNRGIPPNKAAMLLSGKATIVATSDIPV